MLTPLTGQLSPLTGARTRIAWRNFVASLNPVLWYWFNEAQNANLTDHGSAGINAVQVQFGTGLTYQQTTQLGAGEGVLWPSGTFSEFTTAYNPSWATLIDFEYHILMSFWGFTADSRIMGRNIGYRATVNTSGILEVIMPHSGGTVSTFVTNALSLNTWTLMSWRYNGSTTKKVQVYYNGVECGYSAQPAGSGTMSIPTSGMTWGNQQTFGAPIRATVDEILMTGHLTDNTRQLMAASMVL